MYITREIEPRVSDLVSYYPVVTVTGPRQSGKTTMIRHVFPNHAYVNLETRAMRDAVMADPIAFVAQARGPIEGPSAGWTLQTGWWDGAALKNERKCHVYTVGIDCPLFEKIYRKTITNF